MCTWQKSPRLCTLYAVQRHSVSNIAIAHKSMWSHLSLGSISCFLYGSIVSVSYFANTAVNSCQKSYFVFFLYCLYEYKCSFCVFHLCLFEKCLVWIKARTDHPDKCYGNYPIYGGRRLLLRLEACMFFFLEYTLNAPYFIETLFGCIF
jgi:hypothetical protein